MQHWLSKGSLEYFQVEGSTTSEYRIAGFFVGSKFSFFSFSFWLRINLYVRGVVHVREQEMKI